MSKFGILTIQHLAHKTVCKIIIMLHLKFCWTSTANSPTIVHLNVRSLRSHRRDVIKDEVIKLCDIVCFNETSLREFDSFSMRGFPWPTSQCYTANRTEDDEGARGGGVLIAVRNFNSNLELVYSVTGLEAVLITVAAMPRNFYLCSVYRHPQSTVRQFREMIAHIVGHMTPETPALIVGDMNDDQPTSEDSDQTRIAREMEEHNFFAHNIPAPTTDSGSTIDRVYTRNVTAVNISVRDCYYSDHDMVIISPSI